MQRRANSPREPVYDPTFIERYGRWALVAGASMGLGAAITEEAAARGLHVAMVARGEEQLRATAEGVRQRHGVEVRSIVADLAQPDVGSVIARAVDGLEVGLLVYNAAVAPPGRFLEVPLEDHLKSVVVNCSAPITLCHLLAPAMMARGRGGIALVSSMAATQGSVNFGTYNAGKAFEWILAETLWAELGDAGVDVMAMLVGATASPNFASFQETLDPELCGRPGTNDPLERARARLMDPSQPEEVAGALFDQLAQGPVCFADPDDDWVSSTSLALPRREAVGVWRELQETSTRRPDRQAR